MTGYPQLLHTVLDATDVRGLAEFYRQLLGLRYRPDSEPPTDGSPDDEDWLVLLAEDRSEDEDERLYVLADPAGHPFCLFVP